MGKRIFDLFASKKEKERADWLKFAIVDNPDFLWKVRGKVRRKYLKGNKEGILRALSSFENLSAEFIEANLEDLNFKSLSEYLRIQTLLKFEEKIDFKIISFRANQLTDRFICEHIEKMDLRPILADKDTSYEVLERIYSLYRLGKFKNEPKYVKDMIKESFLAKIAEGEGGFDS